MKFEKEMVLEAVFDYDACGNLRFSSEYKRTLLRNGEQKSKTNFRSRKIDT